MNILRRLPLRLGFVAMALGPLLRLAAQVPELPPFITLRFLFLEEKSGAYFVREGEQDRSLGETPYVISGPIRLPRGERVRLYKDLPDPEKKELVRTEILSVGAPPSAVSALVVVSARAASEQGADRVYDTAFYNSDAKAFPAGALRVINLGRAELAARFGGNQFTLPPKQTKVVEPVLDARRRVRTYIGVADPNQGWRLVFNSITSVRSGHRVTGLLVYSPSGMSHTYRAEDLAEMGPPTPGHFWLTYSDEP